MTEYFYSVSLSIRMLYVKWDPENLLIIELPVLHTTTA